MEKSKKIPGFGSYLWFAFWLNLLVSILSGLIVLLVGFVAAGIMWLLGQGDLIRNFMSLIDEQSYDAEVYISTLVILAVLTVFALVVSYFVGRKEFASTYKNFSKKYEGFAVEKAFNFAAGFVAVTSALNLLDFAFKEDAAGIYDWVLIVGVYVASFLVLFFAYKAGSKRIKQQHADIEL